MGYNDTTHDGSESTPVVERRVSLSYKLSHPSSPQELVRYVHMLRAQVFADILSQPIIRTRSIVRAIEVVVEEEVYCFDAGYLTAR